MPTFKKILAGAAIVVAALGIVICLVSFWYSWSLNTQVTDDLVRLATVAERVLDVADTGLTRVDDGLTTVRGAVTVIEGMTRSAGNTLVETNLAFIVLERLVGDTLFPRIVAAQDTAVALTGTIVFELINPITMVYRSVLFGLSWGLSLVIIIFLFDLFVARDGWCGHICPVGAFYGLLNSSALVRVSARGRSRCDECMDCYAVCPEMHVIAPALKAQGEATPIILNRDCTACGRCIDVCPERVFSFTHRFDQRLDEPSPPSGADHVQLKEVA